MSLLDINLIVYRCPCIFQARVSAFPYMHVTPAAAAVLTSNLSFTAAATTTKPSFYSSHWWEIQYLFPLKRWVYNRRLFAHLETSTWAQERQYIYVYVGTYIMFNYNICIGLRICGWSDRSQSRDSVSRLPMQPTAHSQIKRFQTRRSFLSRSS